MLVPVLCSRVIVLCFCVGVDLPSLTEFYMNPDSAVFGPEKEGIENTFIMRSK